MVVLPDITLLEASFFDIFMKDRIEVELALLTEIPANLLE